MARAGAILAEVHEVRRVDHGLAALFEIDIAVNPMIDEGPVGGGP